MRIEFSASLLARAEVIALLRLGGWLGLVLLLTLTTLAPAWAAAPEKRPALEARALFPLEVNGRELPYATNFEPVMPGAEVVFGTQRQFAERMSVQVNGRPVARHQRSFTWRAPEKPGLYTAKVTLSPNAKTASRQTVLVQLFVMVPAYRVANGYLNGYRIGNYPLPLRDLLAYRAPAGFIEVTPALADTPISPNFTLGQFLCKQEGSFPKYLVLQPNLLTKLEELLLEINEQGIQTSSLVVMSGYRTPYYNKAIQNVPSSYHIYGGAADVYIDVDPKDGVMDDVNGDGRHNRADAAYLYKLADTFVTRHNRPDLTGGVGEYGANEAHGPFIHVDVRGSRARWGHKD